MSPGMNTRGTQFPRPTQNCNAFALDHTLAGRDVMCVEAQSTYKKQEVKTPSSGTPTLNPPEVHGQLGLAGWPSTLLAEASPGGAAA